MPAFFFLQRARLALLCTALPLFLGLLLLTACGQRETNIEAGLRSQTLHLGNGAEPVDLDPQLVTGSTEHAIILALFEGLVTLHPQTLEPIPGVAERWDISEDRRVYTFYLRRAARWSNGDPVTAEDFVWSWQRLLTPQLAAAYAYQLFIVSNARAFNEGATEDFTKVGIRALDSHTLEVELANPVPYFLSLLSHFSLFPVHRDTVLAHGSMDQRGSRWTRAGNLVGNGPFALSEWRLNHLIRVEKSRTYWDRDRVRLNEIRFYPIDNVQTEERMFRTGTLHVAKSIPSPKIERYREQHPDQINISPFLGTYFYRFNTTRDPLDSVLVRRALSLAVDRELLVKTITRGGQPPSYTLVPPGTSDYRGPDVAKPDTGQRVSMARELLARAGYPGGRGFPVLELIYNSSEEHRKIAEAIQQMWKEHLGIEVQLGNQDWKVLLSRVNSLDYDIARGSWIGDYLDASTFLDMFQAGGGNNRTGWANATYDQLVADAARSTSRRERNLTLQRAEAILLDEMPILPIYTYTRVELRHPQVKGWWPNLLDHHPYQYVYLEE